MQGHSCRTNDSSMVKTGVRQECLLSHFLFLLAIEWIMTRITGKKWYPLDALEDLDFVDDFALLSHRASKLSVNTDRTQRQQQDKDHESQHEEQQPSHTEREPLEETDSFMYLGSIFNQREAEKKTSKQGYTKPELLSSF